MDVSEQKIILLSTLLQLENRARHAETSDELGFIIANETLRLINYQQAIFWCLRHTGRVRINTVSGVDKPDGNAPYIVFIRDLINRMLRLSDSHTVRVIRDEELDEKNSHIRIEAGINHAVWCPFKALGGEIVGGVILVRKREFEDGEIALAERLSDAYAHAWLALNRQKKYFLNMLLAGRNKRLLQLLVILFAIFLMCQPVRLSVLAPVEIVPRDPLIVSVPMEGVIGQFKVEPNERVEKDQALFILDDTRIRNEYEVSKKALAVVNAEYMRATQKGFGDKKSRADTTFLKAQMNQKRTEMAYLAEVLDRSTIRAERDGVIVFGGVNDWLGKPVAVGEKVARIADPDNIETEIMLPVEDAINLAYGADILIFLNVEPDRPLSATLRKASYDAVLTPEGILAFRLKANLINNEKVPRIGLRGTAKIYGKRVSLFYYLIRRPVTALRQFLGI